MLKRLMSKRRTLKLQTLKLIAQTFPAFALLVFALCALAIFPGCDTNRDSAPDSAKTAPATTSNVPLRVWIVGEVSDPSLVERAWLTGSDQKLEIRTLSVDEFLAEKSSACDVAIYPARLIGELLDRKWLTKLPASLNATSKDASGDDAANEDAPQVPAAWSRQASYGGDLWAVPLGATVPLAIVNQPAVEPTIQAANQATDWNSLLKSLELNAPATNPAETSTASKLDEKAVDRAALVDRFFAIAGGLSDRNPDYGLLFEMQTMRPRLTEPEFIRAAEILLALAQQKSSTEVTALQAITGDASQAWSWLHAQKDPAVAIVAPSLLSPDAIKQTGGKALRIPTKWIGWNTGGAPIASLSRNCRQSARATELLTWLRQSDSRQVLAPIILGIEPAAPMAGSDSSAWQAASLAKELATGPSIPSELRLPRAEEYRKELATSLLKILSSEKSIADALSEATTAWQKITETHGRVLQRSEYEQSLGLIRD